MSRPEMPRRRFVQLGAGTAAGAVLFGGTARRAAASPPTPQFGRLIDPYASYDGQDTCSPSPKPGVVDFRNMVVAAYPGTADWGISRDCGSGGTSEHKEGRAWDWGVPDAGDRGAVEDLIGWLLATDRWGNRHARARRLGIMYFIHDRKIWRAYPPGPGFAPRPCDPHAGFDDCHFDHVHFSFGWRGANRKTSWWHPNSTFPRSADRSWQPGTTDGAAGAAGAPPGLEGC